ncbi:tRNA epoxyqueuosine(34) reductase QueG [Agarivorans sp. 1_MG-2023]|uniref:tRNA epoxyqueuosine(34) reductase QueG n=1 Tax=Agarivorans sp. 1_MG-2023 TaxID=3062634 RepID=UPI0026E3EA60|nr:tRNA epoxyqueuosine(34) reductase QueG [Agarivorans sp. 1_MG-2023]MDO6766063.1 tRNA epoxyqueuosine(34) reductase QueG [Agarivorans sp. 1_MG-2023]
MPIPTEIDLKQLVQHIKLTAKSLGFQQIGITDVDLSQHHQSVEQWLAKDYHGEMDYLARNLELRKHPELLHEGTQRIISVRMDYLPEDAKFAQSLSKTEQAYISRYALGRDYHKLMRKRLNHLGKAINDYCEQQLNMRPFVDSAPVMERQLASKAGLGWTGKHTLVINQDAGSWFFLGELFVDLPLPIDQPVEEQCGDCVACITICPTQAIVEPYQVDARRCISYLTIEYDGVIDEELRPLMGNRIYGCDDCQLACPWNRYAQLTQEADFAAREQLDQPTLLQLFAWTETEFLKKTEGSPIRRIGHQQWLRNIAIALGNASYSEQAIQDLQSKQDVSDVVQEHIEWAIKQQLAKASKASRKTARLIRIIEKGLTRDA